MAGSEARKKALIRLGIRGRLKSSWGGGYDVARCKSCYYYGGAIIKTCDYILLEGAMRPCAPGSRCGVFKEGARERAPLDWIFLGGKDENVWR